MKKKAVFTITACSIAALFLIAVLVIGLKNDGFGISALRREADEGQSVGNAPGAKEYTRTWDPDDSDMIGLDVEWINGEVEVKVGSGPLVRITETSRKALKEDERLQLSSSGGVLKIKWRDSIINFALFQNTYKDLVVEVPKEVAERMEELSCSTASGPISVKGFSAEETDISSASGDLALMDLTGEEAELSTTSGDIALENLSLTGKLAVNTTSGKLTGTKLHAEKTELSTVSGDLLFAGDVKEVEASSVSAAVRVELESCPEKCDMSSVSGNLTLSIPENPGFSAGFSSVSGGFSSDFPVTGDSGRSGRVRYGDGSASFEFSTTSGSMTVERSN